MPDGEWWAVCGRRRREEEINAKLIRGWNLTIRVDPALAILVRPHAAQFLLVDARGRGLALLLLLLLLLPPRRRGLARPAATRARPQHVGRVEPALPLPRPKRAPRIVVLAGVDEIFRESRFLLTTTTIVIVVGGDRCDADGGVFVVVVVVVVFLPRGPPRRGDAGPSFTAVVVVVAAIRRRGARLVVLLLSGRDHEEGCRRE